ncbi:MAG: ATPase, partial [Candidatus Melainabacteria bacterium HGW-Melainabacteria-1]
MTTWHTLSSEASLDKLGAREQGLTQAEADSRLTEYGRNELVEQGIRSPWSMLFEQLSSVMVLILLAAAGLSAVLGDYKDAGVILVIVIFFVSMGVYQEYRAEKAIAALKALAVPNVKVRRDGHTLSALAPELVPGDVLMLEAGDMIPADARLLESHSLKVQEAALTGESEAVHKHPDPLEEADAPLGDRINLVYMGTTVTYGRGVAVVTETGMKTQLGNIATMIQSVTSGQTPLQKKLDQVGKVLAVLAVAFSGLIFIIGMIQGESWRLMLMSAISVAVAAVPEGLPAVLTITLAFGSQRMLKRHALVRKLTGIETLGSVSVICSDKTGTLTQNVMTVTDLSTLDQQGAPAPAAELSPEFALLMLCGLLCNDAELNGDAAHGDPTEVALLNAASHSGFDLTAVRQALPRELELPFDSERKRMSTVHQLSAEQRQSGLLNLLPALALLPEGEHLEFTKGAVDGLLERSSHCLEQGQWVEISPAHRQRFEALNQQLAGEGRRVLGFALRMLPQAPSEPVPGEESEL